MAEVEALLLSERGPFPPPAPSGERATLSIPPVEEEEEEEEEEEWEEAGAEPALPCDWTVGGCRDPVSGIGRGRACACGCVGAGVHCEGAVAAAAWK
jgi:hypothetical protein